jgi:hypothetical protein
MAPGKALEIMDKAQDREIADLDKDKREQDRVMAQVPVLVRVESEPVLVQEMELLYSVFLVLEQVAIQAQDMDRALAHMARARM